MVSSIKRRLRGVAAGQWYPTEAAARRRRLDSLKKSGIVTIGAHTYGSPRIITFEGDATRIVIGSFCSIAETVVFIAGGNHNAGWASTFPFRAKWELPGAFSDGQPSSKGDIVIGSDVWLAEGVVVLSGVKIGHGAVVAAAAVVTRDVPPYSLVAGSPARVMAMRFEEAQVSRLLAIRWWEWEEHAIRANVDLLSGPLTDESLSGLEAAGRR